MPGTRQLCVLDLLDQGVISFTERLDSFLKAEDLDIPYQVIDGIRHQHELPHLLTESWAGILISGSVHSVYEQSDWIQAVEALIREAHAQNIQVFGICFGHQLIASALGGKVAKAPQWEFGTHPVYFKGQHPFLEGVENGVWTSQTHQDHVSELPPAAQDLGLSYQTAHQILAVGSCFGVQFHPEYTPETLRYLGEQRVQRFMDAKLFHSPEHLQSYLNSLRPVDGSRHILRNFLLSLDYGQT
jgi:GMP synthase-like glutamine amidotransferase